MTRSRRGVFVLGLVLVAVWFVDMAIGLLIVSERACGELVHAEGSNPYLCEDQRNGVYADSVVTAVGTLIPGLMLMLTSSTANKPKDRTASTR